MTSQIDLCNRALMRLGTQSAITALDDGSVEATACRAFYEDVLESLLSWPSARGGPVYTWQWAQCTGSGQTIASTNPRWRYQLPLPEDCLQIVGVCDGRPGYIPDPKRRLFECQDDYGTGMTETGQVIFTNLQNIRVAYITKSVDIDYWPATFRRAFWLSLAAAISTSLGLDGNTASAVSQEAEREVNRACMADQRYEVVETGHVPDWLAVRFMDIDRFHDSQRISNQDIRTMSARYVAGGNIPPAPAPGPMTILPGRNGVIPAGLQPRDIGVLPRGGADDGTNYRAATQPEARPGVLVIEETPLGWRAPCHEKITDNEMTDSIA